MLEKSEWKVRPLTVTCRTRVVWDFYNHRGLACFCYLAGERGERGIMVIIICFFLKNPTNSSICLQRKSRCSDVGCCCWPTALPAPAAVQGRGVSCIYNYIYIYIYIYMLFPSQSLISDSTSQLGRRCCVGESRMKAPS